MHRLLIVERVHDGEVDNLAKVDEIGLRSIADALLVGHWLWVPKSARRLLEG